VLLDPVRPQSANVVDAVKRLQDRSLTFDEGKRPAQSVRDHQDIAEQDGCIGLVAAQGLQRRFDGEFRRVAEPQEIRLPLAQALILRQIPARLAHEPERRSIADLSTQRS
jgi:hypothetical protein